MGIEIKCFATLAKFLPENAADYPVEPGETVASLIRKLGIPEKEVTLMFVNALRSAPDSEVKDGDRVGLFPPVGGG
ncbi:MoaD/ThiS family protein [Pseudodesulfovibrio indicus]|jgi:molybdopterin converting factor small subunit|uniref:Molybdopterin converting factor small subunit n=1 Tax=Pseudodesulfovibrio indicus TaxID=1716143 RepID=A0A126QNW2_9BACT|nr:MoaD/ThiS family protein [Pseudodesulfovibrio indicus]AMK11584.1 molybdopterin synthase sulfur carrier subunit [Pseudodesulfovibrio indicus]TDT89991.1 molybdopterin converting factor small subunit [Pseudodesulfovibrio indicus]